MEESNENLNNATDVTVNVSNPIESAVGEDSRNFVQMIYDFVSNGGDPVFALLVLMIFLSMVFFVFVRFGSDLEKVKEVRNFLLFLVIFGTFAALTNQYLNKKVYVDSKVTILSDPREGDEVSMVKLKKNSGDAEFAKEYTIKRETNFEVDLGKLLANFVEKGGVAHAGKRKEASIGNRGDF